MHEYKSKTESLLIYSKRLQRGDCWSSLVSGLVLQELRVSVKTCYTCATLPRFPAEIHTCTVKAEACAR